MQNRFHEEEVMYVFSSPIEIVTQERGIQELFFTTILY